MALTFADTHNLIAYLTKSNASEGFDQIIDFLNASSIKYALTVNHNIYVSCIKQFWSFVSVKKVNDVIRLQALVDKKKVIITKATIREALRLDDAESIDCLPNEEIFTELSRMGYEKPSTKLTFYKAFFSPQWKVGKGFSRVDTPLFEGMIVAQQDDDVADEGAASVAVDDVPAATDEPSIPSPTPTTKPPPPSQELPSTLKDKIAQTLEITKLKQKIKKLERRNKLKVSKLKRLKKVGIVQRVDTSEDTIMDDDVAAVEKDAEIEENADDDEIESSDLKEVVEVVTIAKLMTEVVTAASATITAATTLITTATITAALSAARSRKGVKFNSNVVFLEKTGEQMEEEDNKALKRASESQAEKAKRSRSWMKREDLEKPDVQAQVWKNERSVHGLAKMILLVERRYPLTRFTLDQMLNNVRLEVEEESEVSLELLRFMGTFRETLVEGEEGAFYLGPERPRVYSDLAPEDKERYNADIWATNILLQRLPKDIYTLVNHYTDAKDIWDNVKMLLKGSELTKEDRESQLYDDFEHFRQYKGETIHDYNVWFAKLINDMRNIKTTMLRMQLNSKFFNNMLPEWGRFVTAVKLNRGLRDSNYDQLYAYLKQHEAHANKNKMMLGRFTQHTIDPLALMSSNVLVDIIEDMGTMQGGTGAAGYGGTQNRVGNANPGQARQIKCYNCNDQRIAAIKGYRGGSRGMSYNERFMALFGHEMELEAKVSYVIWLGHVRSLEDDEEGIFDVLFKLESSLDVLVCPCVTAAKKRRKRKQCASFIQENEEDI
nr:integrase, catalytic region, zinc finger, CCHC-type, peptidase aspartic, catalytic [Tanacetum cinerariifolium]